MKRRFEKGATYVEIEESREDGTYNLVTQSGRIGIPGPEKTDRFPSSAKRRVKLQTRVEKLRAGGFREVPEGGVAAKVSRLFALGDRIDAASAQKGLALVKELEAMDASFRKRLAEAEIDLRKERALFHLRLGEAAFRAQEPRYWARTDRSGLPNMSMPIYYYEYDAVNRAMKSCGARPKAGGAAPDYREAIRELERSVDIAPKVEKDAPLMLATIAIRRKDYAEAALWLRLLTKGKDATGLGAFLTGIVRAFEGKWAEAEKIFLKMGKRSSVGLTNRAFVALGRGNDEEAIDLLGRALQVDTDNGYAAFHLKRLQKRGPSAAAEGVRSRLNHLKRPITIRSPREFYEKVGDIGDALRLRHDISAPPSPMPEEEIERIRIAKFRNRTSASCPIPESAKAILRYDKDFPLWGRRGSLLRAIRAYRGVAPSLDIQEVVRREVDTSLRQTLRKLPKAVAVWNDDKALPACVEILPPGDQRIFFYVGEPDAQGELPIANFDPEPCVWITSASLIHLVIAAAIEDGLKIECSIDFEAQLAKAIRRNRRHEERWSDDPRVATLVG